MAKWISVVAYGSDFLINFDNIDSIADGKQGKAVLEWGNGQCQLTIDQPKFKEIQHELEEANKSGK